MRNYKFRLYPSKIVETGLDRQLDLCRWTYNRLLEELNEARETGIKLKRNDTQKLLVKLKEEKPHAEAWGSSQVGLCAR